MGILTTIISSVILICSLAYTSANELQYGGSQQSTDPEHDPVIIKSVRRPSPFYTYDHMQDKFDGQVRYQGKYGGSTSQQGARTKYQNYRFPTSPNQRNNRNPGFGNGNNNNWNPNFENQYTNRVPSNIPDNNVRPQSRGFTLSKPLTDNGQTRVNVQSSDHEPRNTPLMPQQSTNTKPATIHMSRALATESQPKAEFNNGWDNDQIQSKGWDSDQEQSNGRDNDHEQSSEWNNEHEQSNAWNNDHEQSNAWRDDQEPSKPNHEWNNDQRKSKPTQEWNDEPNMDETNSSIGPESSTQSDGEDQMDIDRDDRLRHWESESTSETPEDELSGDHGEGSGGGSIPWQDSLIAHKANKGFKPLGPITTLKPNKSPSGKTDKHDDVFDGSGHEEINVSNDPKVNEMRIEITTTNKPLPLTKGPLRKEITSTNQPLTPTKGPLKGVPDMRKEITTTDQPLTPTEGPLIVIDKVPQKGSPNYIEPSTEETIMPIEIISKLPEMGTTETPIMIVDSRDFKETSETEILKGTTELIIFPIEETTKEALSTDTPPIYPPSHLMDSIEKHTTELVELRDVLFLPELVSTTEMNIKKDGRNVLRQKISTSEGTTEAVQLRDVLFLPELVSTTEMNIKKGGRNLKKILSTTKVPFKADEASTPQSSTPIINLHVDVQGPSTTEMIIFPEPIDTSNEIPKTKILSDHESLITDPMIFPPPEEPMSTTEESKTQELHEEFHIWSGLSGAFIDATTTTAEIDVSNDGAFAPGRGIIFPPSEAPLSTTSEANVIIDINSFNKLQEESSQTPMNVSEQDESIIFPPTEEPISTTQTPKPKSFRMMPSVVIPTTESPIPLRITPSSRIAPSISSITTEKTFNSLTGFTDCTNDNCSTACGSLDSGWCDQDFKNLCMCPAHRFVSVDIPGHISMVHPSDDQELSCSNACNLKLGHSRILTRPGGSKHCICITDQMSPSGVTLCDPKADHHLCRDICEADNAICAYNGICLCGKSNWALAFKRKPDSNITSTLEIKECNSRCLEYHHDYVSRIYDNTAVEGVSENMSPKFKSKYCLCGPESPEHIYNKTKSFLRQKFQVCTGLKCKKYCGVKDAVCEPRYRRACLCKQPNIFIENHLWSRLPSAKEKKCEEVCLANGLKGVVIENNPEFDPGNVKSSSLYKRIGKYNPGKFCHCIVKNRDMNAFRPCTDEICQWLCGHFAATCNRETRRDCICNTHKMIGSIGRIPEPGEAACDSSCRQLLQNARVIDITWNSFTKYNGTRTLQGKYCGCVKPTTAAGLTHCEGGDYDHCPTLCKNPRAYCTREKYCECGTISRSLMSRAVRLPNGEELEECGEVCRTWLWPIANDLDHKPYIYDEERQMCSSMGTCPRMRTAKWHPSKSTRNLEMYSNSTISQQGRPNHHLKRFCLCSKKIKIQNSRGTGTRIQLPAVMPHKAPTGTECIGHYQCTIDGNTIHVR